MDCSYANVGRFDVTTTQPNVNDTAVVTGYPCDLPPAELGAQYTSTGNVLGLEGFLVGEKRIVRFDAHAAGCNSGSPVYKHDTFEVYAIVTQAYSNEGKGVLIKEEVVQGLRAAVRINLSSRVYLPLVRR